jgi:hypothetical protein
MTGLLHFSSVLMQSWNSRMWVRVCRARRAMSVVGEAWVRGPEEAAALGMVSMYGCGMGLGVVGMGKRGKERGR